MENDSLTTISAKLKDFSSILEKIEDLDEKSKLLWSEVYKNSIEDRNLAYGLLIKLINICGSNTTEYAMHGRTMSSYIERMNKANDQLMRLSELIRKAEEEQSTIDPDEMFAKINK